MMDSIMFQLNILEKGKNGLNMNLLVCHVTQSAIHKGCGQNNIFSCFPPCIPCF